MKNLTLWNGHPKNNKRFCKKKKGDEGGRLRLFDIVTSWIAEPLVTVARGVVLTRNNNKEIKKGKKNLGERSRNEIPTWLNWVTPPGGNHEFIHGRFPRSFVLTLFIFKAPNYMLARTNTERVVTEFFFYYRSGQKRLFLTQQGGSGRCASGKKQEGLESSDFGEHCPPFVHPRV